MDAKQVDLIYLAHPYTHENQWVREARFQSANRAAAKLMGEGKYVFSPISHTHPIVRAGAMMHDWQYWEGYDRAMLKLCTKMIVVMHPGWKESKGVSEEIRIAREMGIPVEYMESI